MERNALFNAAHFITENEAARDGVDGENGDKGRDKKNEDNSFTETSGSDEEDWLGGSGYPPSDIIETLNHTIEVYPNPTDGSLTISPTGNSSEEIRKMQITVLTINGQEVDAMQVKNETGFTIDLSKVKSGIYILKIIIDNEVKMIRITKE